MAVGLYVLSEPIVRVIYGATWEPVIPILKVLSIFGLLKSLEYVFISFIQSSGKPKIVSYVTIFQTVFLAVFLYPSIHMFGVIGVAMTLCAGTFISLIYFLTTSIRVLHMKGGASLFGLGIPVLASAGMGGALVSLEAYVGSVSIFALLMYIVVGVIVYTVLTTVIDWCTGKQYYHQINNLTNGKLSRIREYIVRVT
jgi:O-antigen/teichoic acid export membrane protein